MKGTMLYGARDVRFEIALSPKLSNQPMPLSNYLPPVSAAPILALPRN